MKKVARFVVALVLAVALGGAFSASQVLAAGHKVDCNKVMQELKAGKKPKDVAKDLKISRSSVYRCRRRERLAEKKASKAAKPAASPAGAPAAH